ncbi:MAG: alpha-amylase family glycosyl hydrolase [Lachnospiraceae bacterium]|jgi:cyclomaltodextrinase|nr:alpha-amylase family glycosyl hydrolase [Lachnospiraceae bacterium]MEE3461369.1 alpha-amylase family glycosyl hydrolase [Lachnospiraceae bacterium]
MWAERSVFYQIYPLGMCGAPFENDGSLTHRILKVIDWIPHIKKLGVNAIYFSPVFESDSHGYNTRDYRKLDVRLGTNDDFKEVVTKLHENGIKVIIDGVFNHVGRGFFAFKDVQEKKWDSRYRDWFNISFDGNSAFNDGFWYEGWEGCYDLVKLNLKNPAVADYLMGSVKQWIDEFDIDGLRLDVAYMVDRDFLKRLRRDTSQWKQDFFLLGEILGGDYRTIMNDEMCHSATNYECYKGIYSALNSMNLFEIVHSLLRQFGKDPWCLYTDMHPVSFVDNHDVSRIATILNNKAHIKLAYAIMYGMPGIPMVYYGSEWGAEGDKNNGDPSLRPYFEKPEWNELCDYIAALSKAELSSEAMQYGDFKSLVLTNKQCIFERESANDRIMVAVNADASEYRADFNARAGRAHDLITGETIDFGGGLVIPPCTAYILQPY